MKAKHSRLTSEDVVKIAAYEATRLNVPWSDNAKAKRVLISGNWKVTAITPEESAQTTFFVQERSRKAILHKVLYSSRFSKQH